MVGLCVSTHLAASCVWRRAAGLRRARPGHMCFSHIPAATPQSYSCFHRRCELRWASGEDRRLQEKKNIYKKSFYKFLHSRKPADPTCVSRDFTMIIFRVLLLSVISSSPRNFSLKLMFFSRLLSDRAFRAASGLFCSSLKRENTNTLWGHQNKVPVKLDLPQKNKKKTPALLMIRVYETGTWIKCRQQHLKYCFTVQ